MARQVRPVVDLTPLRLGVVGPVLTLGPAGLVALLRQGLRLHTVGLSWPLRIHVASIVVA